MPAGGEGAPEKTQLVTPKKNGRAISKELRQKRFLEEYGHSLNVMLAARKAGVTREQHYRWVDDPEYAAKFEEAKQAGKEYIEAEIYRRGVRGYDEAVWYQGVKCGTVRKYSDNLLMFYGKKHMPEYRDNVKAEIEHKGDVSLQAAGAISLMHLTDEQYDNVKSILRPGLPAPQQSELGADIRSGGPETSEE